MNVYESYSMHAVAGQAEGYIISFLMADLLGAVALSWIQHTKRSVLIGAALHPVVDELKIQCQRTFSASEGHLFCISKRSCL